MSCISLLPGLDADDYMNYMRMDKETCKKLLECVKPHLQKQDTFMRKALTPHVHDSSVFLYGKKLLRVTFLFLIYHAKL